MCEKEWVNVCLLSIIISVVHNMDVHTRRELGYTLEQEIFEGKNFYGSVRSDHFVEC